MAQNDFKSFAVGAGANVTSQADWEALAALVTGFQSGKASSAQINKAIRQASFIAAALAQYTSDKTGGDVLDDGDQAAFITKMAAAFGKDFQPLDATLTALALLTGSADKLAYFNGDDTAALTALTAVGRDIIGKATVADVLTYLGLGTAATKDVGTGENQIPDMSSFGAGSGWSQLPNGKLLQWGTYTGSATTGTINFPVPFPISVGRVIMSLSGTSADAGSIAYVLQDDNSLSKTSFFFRRAGAQVRFNWFCIGE
ncbi:gp53-like domain-containing protein [Citrobacter amalonaticus]|uniref:gp53-like domain-containing protein n=2 Tax=Citrobacter TaxID=544 RepID=UPI00388F4188